MKKWILGFLVDLPSANAKTSSSQAQSRIAHGTLTTGTEH